MTITNRNSHRWVLALVGTLTWSCAQINAFTLRDARELCKGHRFILFAAVSTPIIYIYTHKFIEKAIQDYKNRTAENGQVSSTTTTQEYIEGLADAFIKATKLVGTIFKVFRATSCPDEGKSAGYQWLDDFSQIA